MIMENEVYNKLKTVRDINALHSIWSDVYSRYPVSDGTVPAIGHLGSASDYQEHISKFFDNIYINANDLQSSIKDVFFSVIDKKLRVVSINQKLKWYFHEDNRACFWLYCRLCYRFNLTDHVRSSLVDMFYFLEEVIFFKKIPQEELGNYYSEYYRHSARFDFDWLDKLLKPNQKLASEWLRKYLQKSTMEAGAIPIPAFIHARILDYSTNKLDCISLFDSLDKRFEECIYTYNKIRTSWNQKSKRKSDVSLGKKQCNFTLSQLTVKELDEKSKQLGKTKNQLVEEAIQAYCFTGPQPQLKLGY